MRAWICRIIKFFNDNGKKMGDYYCSFPGSAWERVLGGSAACSVRRWQSHLGKRSQAEPGNEHRSEFALNLTAMGFSLMRAWICRIIKFFNDNGKKMGIISSLM